MGSETIQLPVIDFSGLDLESKTPKWDEVRSQLHKALVECGSFEALFDKVSLDLRKSFFVMLKELFDLPPETKQKNVSDKPFYGYLGQYPVYPLYESMGIDYVNVLEKIESFENTLWPEGNPSFSKTVQAFTEKVLKLDLIIRTMVLEILGVEKYIDEHTNSINYLMRVTKYSAPHTEEAKEVGRSHIDNNIMTILCQNEVDGLDVETKEGKWVTYQPSSPHSFVVIIGESFRAWTNGRLHAATHGVFVKGNEARYSIGLFALPKRGYMVKTPDELVDEEHPLLFKPYDYVEFLNAHLLNPDTLPELSLKTYCGV